MLTFLLGKCITCSIARSLVHLLTLLKTNQIVSMQNTSRLLLITYLQCLIFKPSLESKFTCPLAGRIWWYPGWLLHAIHWCASASASLPPCQTMLHHSLLISSINNHCLQYFNLAGDTFISRWYLWPYQSMPLRWSSFLIIELNYPIQALFRASAPISIGRSFNNWAFNSASRAYSFALAIYSKSIYCRRLNRTSPRRHLQCICSRPCKSFNVNIMVA